ncbi:MAG: YaiI/YqxD family protein [Candidatus Chromulinivorax sp.]
MIYVDADACPVKEEVFRVARRHDMQVYLVSNSALSVTVDENVHKILVNSDLDAADDWICQRIKTGDIVITTDILLADRCLKNGACAIAPTGKVFTSENIGAAKAMRELRAYLRETGLDQSYNANFSKQKRSDFLQSLEKVIQLIKRNF